jgi:antibiotic biosynthesis monooxygenase (ABM) superfamily enzyme
MIKVIVGYKLKEGADYDSVLRKLRSQAMQFPGFIGAENLVSEKDYHVLVLVSAWDKIENWRQCEKSKIRQDILEQAAPLLAEKPRVTIYTVIPTVRWFG